MSYDKGTAQIQFWQTGLGDCKCVVFSITPRSNKKQLEAPILYLVRSSHLFSHLCRFLTSGLVVPNIVRLGI
jgi:hypothetical protein